MSFWNENIKYTGGGRIGQDPFDWRSTPYFQKTVELGQVKLGQNH